MQRIIKTLVKMNHERGDEGESIVEYALLLALICIVCIAAIYALGGSSDNDDEGGLPVAVAAAEPS